MNTLIAGIVGVPIVLMTGFLGLMSLAQMNQEAILSSSPIYQEILSEMDESLEETAVLHPSFFAQDKEIVLGGKNEADFSGNGVLEDAEHDLNQDFYLHKTAIVGKYNDSLEPSAKEDLLNATTTVRISKGTYSLGDKIVNE